LRAAGEAIVAAKAAVQGASKVIHLSLRPVMDHKKVMALAPSRGCVLLCGRYEGVTSASSAAGGRGAVRSATTVLSGGELAAMVLMDAVVRQLPGALGDGCRRAGLVRERAPGLPAVHAAGNVRGEAVRRCCSRAITRRSSAGG